MGFETVELVLRCEEHFAIDLPDWKCERVKTGGDLYTIICEGLELPPIANPTSRTGFRFLSRAISDPQPRAWTPEDIWATLVWVITDHLQVDQTEVTCDATFQDDLGCD